MSVGGVAVGLKFEPEVIELTDDVVRAELLAFEEKYGMLSELFIVRFNRGKLGHCDDFLDWAVLLGIACDAGIRHLTKT